MEIKLEQYHRNVIWEKETHLMYNNQYEHSQLIMNDSEALSIMTINDSFANLL